IFKGENPPAHHFSKPGIYVVKYKATIDTSPVVLKNVDVLKVECVDQLGIGQPDLYMFITDPNGTRVYDSSPAINNTPLPHTFPVGLTLGTGNYKLEIIDEDSGLKGGDDPCGTVTFNILSGDTLVAGGMTVVLEIDNDLQEILSRDTLIVYPNPDKPIVSAPNGLTECGNANTVVLKSNSPADNQWLLGGQPIPGATASTYDPSKSGYYAVRATNAFGCTATSDSAYVGIYLKPATPIYVNVNNLLIVKDSTAFPPTLFSLQWYKDNTPIAGATDYRYCTKSSGSYGVEVKDLTTGCSSYYGATVAYNPNVSNCFSSDTEAPLSMLSIFPNPSSTGEVQVSLPQPAPQESLYRLWDATGRLVRSGPVAANSARFSVPCEGLPAGVYSLEVQGVQLRALGKVVVMR
ncbi:MAG TPA: hypothetical protein PK971_09110, partial [Saprospiraceae bacterium]|nr:hypothetical protein [Saprospiraceae bacterium]